MIACYACLSPVRMSKSGAQHFVCCRKGAAILAATEVLSSAQFGQHEACESHCAPACLASLCANLVTVTSPLHGCCAHMTMIYSKWSADRKASS